MSLLLNSSNKFILRAALVGLALAFFVSTTVLNSSANQAKPLPDGPGKAETQKLCASCHDIEKSVSERHDRAGWQQTIEKMLSFGAKATDEEFNATLNYLSTHFAADEVPKIKINKATALELESGLSLKRSQAKAIIEYRTANGNFKSIEDLKKVPGIEAEKIDAKKDRLSFDDEK